jgi:hypothetical protein
MKKIILITMLLFFLQGSAWADDFLGAPLISDGEILTKTDVRLEMTTSMTHDQVLAFYKEALDGQADIKFRDWKEATYIEDDGKLDWHSITIAKEGEKGTAITIMKDTWSWILGTLTLRFIGVFIVLLFLYLGMIISGSIISRSVARSEAKNKAVS